MTTPCARCGVALDPGNAPAAGDTPALLADLCLDCLDAVWDAVMAELKARRGSLRRRPAT